MSPLSSILPEGFSDDVAEAGSDGLASAETPLLAVSSSAEQRAPRGGRSRGGRPPKADAERRRHKYLVSANDAERDAIDAAAAALGLAPAVYLRQAGLDTRAGAPGAGSALSKRADDVLYHRLSRIGVRLQALARRVAAEGRTEDEAALAALVEEVVAVRGTL